MTHGQRLAPRTELQERRRSPSQTVSAIEPSELVRFWSDAGPSRWFSKDPAFDRLFRERYIDAHLLAARGRLEAWLATPRGALALLLLTDQFPRNAFRGTAHMYATDGLARSFARRASDEHFMDDTEVSLRPFFCLPFAHSEYLADQDFSVQLHEQIGQPWLSHAHGHRDIIRRFGRFPHRNRVLGRQSTREEQDFLDAGGFAG